MTTEDIVSAATIRNTSDPREVELTALLAIGATMGGDRDPMPGLIEGQEKAGQTQLVNSDRLPTESSNSDEEYAAIGVILGPPDPRDPLFRPATLPPGWKRQATDHSMGSQVVDELGRERISVFYKAAFYDRKASMYIVTPCGYLRSAMWYDTEPVLDDVWLTRELAIESLADLEEGELAEAAKADRYRADGRGDADFWIENAQQHRAEAAKYAAMRTRIAAVTE